MADMKTMVRALKAAHAAGDTAAATKIAKAIQATRAAETVTVNTRAGPVEAEINAVNDFGRSLASGVRMGVEETLGLPADAANSNSGARRPSYPAIDPNAMPLPEQDVPGTTADINQLTTPVLGENYDPKSTAGKYAQRVGEFLPGMIGPGGPMRWMARGVTDVLAPAIASETAGQITEGTDLEPYARMGGALLAGPAATLPFRGVPTEAALRFEQTTGGHLSAGQRTGRRGLQYAESELAPNEVADITENQQRAFTSRMMDRLGLPPGTTAHGDEVAQARRVVGGRFDTLSSQAGNMPLSAQEQRDLMDAAATYGRREAASNVTQVPQDYVNDIRSFMVQTSGQNPTVGMIDGQQYQQLRSNITRDIRTGTPREVEALTRMRGILDNAMETHLRTTNPDLAGQWAEARRQYADLLAIEDAVAVQPAQYTDTGLLSPNRLRASSRMVSGNQAAAGGRNEMFNEATNAANVLRAMPESGTSARAAARFPAMVAGAAIGGGVGSIPGAVGGAAMSMFAPAMTGRILMSDPVQRMLSTPLDPSRATLAAYLAQKQFEGGQPNGL